MFYHHTLGSCELEVDINITPWVDNRRLSIATEKVGQMGQSRCLDFLESHDGFLLCLYCRIELLEPGAITLQCRLARGGGAGSPQGILNSITVWAASDDCPFLTVFSSVLTANFDTAREELIRHGHLSPVSILV